ncbi:hypothetical protein [Nocardia spumae]|uniref:hypothetical protein n=1 Tax=Nocardia spumae TaxID=2887190 RepID=UPI001D15730C|nr:hypothetical protein [Nocardia spumae]
MIVGVLRETAARERRVALTPDGAARLIAAGMVVVVEAGAGRAAGFGDHAYRLAGATLAPGPAAVVAACDVLAWVKPTTHDLRRMTRRPNLTLIGFQDPLRRAARIAELRALGVESIAFELFSHETGERDALSAMSRIAGSVAYSAGRRLVPRSVRRPIRSLILGCGQAGLAAIAAADACGAEPPVVLARRAELRDAADAQGPNIFHHSAEIGAEQVLQRIRADTPDLIFCAAVRRGQPAPLLVDRVALDVLGAGAVVVDLTAKAGGNCSATVADTTVVLRNGVVVTHRSNYPARRPAAASRAYSAAVAASILRLAAGGDQRASKDSATIGRT